MDLDICVKLFAPFASGTLYAGFSGGADSTAALLAALHFRERSGCRLIAVHFDHGLRGEESQREACEAEQFAAARQIEFRCIRLKLSAGPNLEAAAREARLAYWRTVAADRSDTAVVLGHHADDRAENLLLRLARGANASGLTALRERSVVDGVTFLRPLLRFRRAGIEEFLNAAGIDRWANDSSNADERYARNALRHTILPAFRALSSGSEAGLFHSLDALEADAEFLEAAAEEQFRRIAGETVTPLDFWRKQPPALLIRLLRRFVATQSGRDYIPNRRLLERFTALPEKCVVSRRIPLDANRSLRIRGNTLALELPSSGAAAGETEPGPTIWDWRTKPETHRGKFRFSAEALTAPRAMALHEAMFDADALPCPLLIDRRRPGDRLIPFGETAPKSLKKLRIDRKLPAETALPVVRSSDGRIVWAPGIRHTAAAPVTPATAAIVHLAMRTDFSGE